jgi:hypothetical protein
VPRGGKPAYRDDPLFREFMEWRASRSNTNRTSR